MKILKLAKKKRIKKYKVKHASEKLFHVVVAFNPDHAMFRAHDKYYYLYPRPEKHSGDSSSRRFLVRSCNRKSYKEKRYFFFS